VNLVERVAPGADLTPDVLAGHRDAGRPFPLVADDVCTFAFSGPAIGVRLVHFGVGLPTDLSFNPVGSESGWWLLALRFPHGSRLEYKVEVTDSFGTRLIEDQLNPRLANHPFGANSVCEVAGYAEPDWAIEHDGVPRGELRDVAVDSAALGRQAHATVHLPAEFTDGTNHPLLVVHDGGDYLRYAAAATVLDNLIAASTIAPCITVFLHPGERLVEYADDERHHRYLTAELLPRLEAELPIDRDPARRCLAGSSFGAVAALSVATRSPGTFGRLLLQSGSFAGAGTGCWPRPEPLWQPIKRFVHRFTTEPHAVAERIYVTCGVFESLICENRGFVPVLRDAGMDVNFDERLDGHNWASWRDSLGTAVPALLGR
jgi:enterochelin esterase-like enzyme